jgi:hypothetical protein
MKNVYYLFHAGFLLGLYFDLEDGGDVFFRNVSLLSQDYTALRRTKPNYSNVLEFM